MSGHIPHPKDKWIPWYFVIFFAVIAILDGVFVYMAVSTQTGLVTEQAYEKGLAFDDILATARSQPDIQQDISYIGGVLRWKMAEKEGRPITNAAVSAQIIRPVQDGHDFAITLEHKGKGVYEATPTLPLPGLWQAKLSGKWNNKQYQRAYEFIAAP